MPPPSQNAIRTRHPTIHMLPAEILSIIFQLVVEVLDDLDGKKLMGVCRHWYAIMLSTPGIPSGLWINNSTTVEMVRSATRGRKWRLNVVVDVKDERIREDFNADVFDECFMAVIEEAPRWETLSIFSLPQSGKCKAFQIVPLLKTLAAVVLTQDCDLGGFFEPLMTAITTTATPHLTGMVLEILDAVLYLVQLDCLHVFRSLTGLTIQLSKRMESSANILPHLQRLETFNARHLYLPIYPPNDPLPLIQTLRHLSLQSVSVQWMAGKVFPVLQSCDITSPHQIDTICRQPVTMPACTSLTFDSNNLDPLRYFHDLPLDQLSVTSGQWNITRGNLQLLSICHITISRALHLTELNIQIRCSQQLLTCILRLLPVLKALKLGLASPRALNETFFQAFANEKSNADSPHEVGALPPVPLCSKLVELEVNYKRWLRGPERTALPLVFGHIASSRRSEGDFQLLFSFRDPRQGRRSVWRYTGSIHDYGELVIGISSPHGICSFLISEGTILFPFQVEYLVVRHWPPIDCLLPLHHLVELRVGGVEARLPSGPHPNLPLFHTLRVFEARNIHPSFLVGQTF